MVTQYLRRGADPYATLANLMRSSEREKKADVERQRKEKGSIWNALIAAVTNQVMAGKALPTTAEETGQLALSAAKGFTQEPTEIGAVKSAVGAYETGESFKAKKMAEEKAARAAEAEQIKMDAAKINIVKSTVDTLKTLHEIGIPGTPKKGYTAEQVEGASLRMAPVKGKEKGSQMVNYLTKAGLIEPRSITNVQMRTKMLGKPEGIERGFVSLPEGMEGPKDWRLRDDYTPSEPMTKKMNKAGYKWNGKKWVEDKMLLKGTAQAKTYAPKGGKGTAGEKGISEAQAKSRVTSFISTNENKPGTTVLPKSVQTMKGALAQGYSYIDVYKEAKRRKWLK